MLLKYFCVFILGKLWESLEICGGITVLLGF